MLHTFLFILFSIPFMCHATDLKPWFGNEYEVELRATVLYQNYDSISSTSHRQFKYNANDAFMTLSAEYPFKRYSGEFEATAASTRHQSIRWDNFRFTGRYQFLDEFEAEDPISLTAGLLISMPFTRALKDISSFHHGHIEAEGHIAFGKKYGYPLTKNYIFRWWNVFCMGSANASAFWLRDEACCEYNYDDVQKFRLFVNTICGFGKKSLNPHHFHGYGHIKHRSVDLGFRYGFTMDCWGTLSLAYARRIYALNFPKNANLVWLRYYFPFGTQVLYNY